MKKRLIAVVVAVCALAVLAIGSTFAFFTSNDAAGNTFTMGNVKIKLTETTHPDETKNIKDGSDFKVVDDDIKGISYEGALPGDTFSKEPTVTNTGSNTAWIRVQISVTTGSRDKKMINNVADLQDAIEKAMDDTDEWVKGDDGYLYYTAPVAPGETADLFKTVTIPTSWGNEAADAKFSIDIIAQAVQYDNNGANWDDAEWIGDFDN